MKLLVTAGPTREAIDAVRFISNRSTGRMGYACAAAGIMRDWPVRLISGPVALPVPTHATHIPVTTAADMLTAVESHFEWCDALIMAAAVADWTPVAPEPGKLKKGAAELTITCRPTQDILRRVAARKGARLVVGFAAEAGDPTAEAIRKLETKQVDLIVGNDILGTDSGFAADTNRVVLVSRDAPPESLPLLTKDDVAARILDRIEAMTL